MNSKAWKLALGGVALTFALTACGGSSDDGEYIPDPVDADYATYTTVVAAHPGMHCVMEWGPGLYVSNCYPVTAVIPYSVGIYYGRGVTVMPSGWSVAPRPANYSTVYVNRKTYTPGRTTNVTVNKNVTINQTVINNNQKTSTTNVQVNKPAAPAAKPAQPAPKPAAPAAPRSGSRR